MLRIRFSRTGKVGQSSFRIVLKPRTAPAKGRALEVLGNYMPARNPKIISVKKDRIEYWISKGAIPTDSVATLLKKEGFSNMDRYLEPRNKKRARKGEKNKAAEIKKPSPEVPKPTEPKTEQAETGEKKEPSAATPSQN